MPKKMSCPWCDDGESEVEENLCLMHEAERLGVSYEQLQKQQKDSIDQLLWVLGYGS
jgi:hypothetical protein